MPDEDPPDWLVQSWKDGAENPPKPPPLVPRDWAVILNREIRHLRYLLAMIEANTTDPEAAAHIRRELEGREVNVLKQLEG